MSIIILFRAFLGENNIYLDQRLLYFTTDNSLSKGLFNPELFLQLLPEKQDNFGSLFQLLINSINDVVTIKQYFLKFILVVILLKL